MSTMPTSFVGSAATPTEHAKVCSKLTSQGSKPNVTLACVMLPCGAISGNQPFGGPRN